MRTLGQVKTLIGLPTYDGNANIQTVLAAALQSGSPSDIAFSQDSMLTRCFNRLWSVALASREKGFTHFAMLHADIIPEPQWLGRLHKVMAVAGAEVLSVISPIKSPAGLTSTGIRDKEDPWKVNRFTMHQLQTLPETFTHPRLVVNTGCMLVDIRGKWCDGLWFRTEDAIANGRVYAMTEDYLFSADAAAKGARVCATREVQLVHVGKADYTNVGAWGAIETDKVAPDLGME